MSQKNRVSKPDVALLVGTRKGAFVLSSDSKRKKWELSEVYCRGGDVYHFVQDRRNGGTVYAAVNYTVWGAEVHISEDLGGTWRTAENPPKFENRGGKTLNKIWHIAPGRASEPGVLYAGADPASLFRSNDDGENWEEIRSVADHPTNEHWFGGMGGLCLHSIALDERNPARMWVGMSAVGVFGTRDGGETWTPQNKNVRADFIPGAEDPEYGQCPHKVLNHPAREGLIYQQNHCGVYRTDDGGDTWHDITDGLPSRFGMALGLHPHDADTLYVLPEDNVLADGEVGGDFRIVSGNKFRVFRSRDGGRNWEALTNGLPQKNAYLHSMREGMATDSLGPCGVYVGTTNGQIFYSRDEGDSWEMMIDNLPPINSLEVAHF
ncbi:MAG: exo-alpha-sialidase [Chloroflexota bacterium]|nr:exo-alpha-sialidase [Chloroflexota bacterium]